MKIDGIIISHKEYSRLKKLDKLANDREGINDLKKQLESALEDSDRYYGYYKDECKLNKRILENRSLIVLLRKLFKLPVISKD